MKRRHFIQQSSLMAFSISAFGAIHWDGKKYVGDTPTTTDILGPFYRPGAPFKSNIIPPNSKGIPLHLSGVIYDEDGITPNANAMIEIWHCNENQEYDNTSDDFLCRGAIRTGKDGRYKFTTIMPVPYKANPDNDSSWRPAHIHIRVSSPSQQDLITQIYFKGDDYLHMDSSASAPEAVNRTLKVTTTPEQEKEVQFDIVLRKTYPLSDATYSKIEGLYRTDQKLADSERIYEFVRRDDILFLKLKGQYLEGLTYVGNNTFEGGRGFPKVTFDLQEGGHVKATIAMPKTNIVAEKFLKYSE